MKPVVDIYNDREQKGQKNSRLTPQESQELLLKLTNIYPMTTICLDALDEVNSESRTRLLKVLKLVIDKSKTLVKIFATSRNDPDILQQFNAFPRIDVHPDDNFGDIQAFINMELGHAISDGRLLLGDVSPNIGNEICDTLSKRARGMFQLAVLQITYLCQMDTERDVRDNLNGLPDTLTKAYEGIYTRFL
ncbi:hypothetical protein K440DRAFT_572817, partial [Wilcoxina mikolae CBS 423.85]